MKPAEKSNAKGITRREALKYSGLALGGLAFAGAGGSAIAASSSYPPGIGLTDKNTYFTRLKPYVPGTEPVGVDQMRISFMGTWYTPRMAQACNSVFVEVGPGSSGTAPDQFVFDCGAGVVARYYAMGISLSRMDKIFLTHIHGDHMSDLTYIYCFGPSSDRKKPLYVWGPGRSGLTWTSPDGKEIYGPYEDGTADYCKYVREASRWHTESFSFETTAVVDDEFEAPTWTCGDAAPSEQGWQSMKDGYDLVSFELNWRTEGGVAYQNDHTGVTVTHFPAVHARQGSISYKLEWNGFSMIFTGDTKPNYYLINQATSGVDVLIHEIASPPDVWVYKDTGLTPDDGAAYTQAYNNLKNVQDSSHTPQKMFGYILSLLDKPPRLAVGTHFAATDDVIRYALADIRSYYPKGDVSVATDLMVIDVTKKSIRQRRAVVSDFVWQPPLDPQIETANFDPPKYWKYYVDENSVTHKDIKVGDPYAQLDPNADVIDYPDDYDER